MGKKKVVIIGGGFTGITCAYLLGKAGHEVTVYEKEKRLGGLASSFHANGFSYDYGPHEFCTENQELIDMLHEIVGDDLLVLSKHTSQFLNNKFVDYPLKPLQLIRIFSPFLLARIGIEVVYQRLKSIIYSYRDYTFKRWVVCRFGSTMYEMYFGPYTKKVFGVDPDSLDARKASSRISFNSIFDLLIKSFFYFFLHREDYSTIHSPLKNKFYYTKGGIGTIPQRIAERSGKMGVRYMFSQELKSIDLDSSEIFFKSGHIHQGFDYLISTIPIPVLLTTLGLKEEIMPLKYRSMIFVNLEVPQRPLTPYTWIYFPETDIIFQRMTEYSNIEEGMAPGGRSSVGLEISCFHEDEVWNADDQTIVERVRRDLDRINILPHSVPCKYHVFREHYEYPIQLAGYLEIVWELLSPVRKLSNIVTTGRQGLFKYCNMNECMEMAAKVAQEVDAGVQNFNYSLNSHWKGAGMDEEKVVVLDNRSTAG